MNKLVTLDDPDHDRRFIPFTEEQLQALADLYRAGHSTRKLSARYGISPCTVRRRLLALGVTLRGHAPIRSATVQVMEIAHRMRKEGRGWRSIAEATGVKADTIMGAMRRERTRLSEQ